MITRYYMGFIFYFLVLIDSVTRVYVEPVLITVFTTFITFSFAYVVLISRPIALRQVFQKKIVVLWLILGFMFVASIFSPLSQSGHQNIVSAVNFIISFPFLILLVSTHDGQNEIRVIEYLLKGILIGALVVCTLSVFIYDFSSLGTRGDILGGLSASVLGRSASFVVIIALFFARTTKYKSLYLLVGLAFAFLFIVESKGSILALVLGGVYIIIRKRALFAFIVFLVVGSYVINLYGVAWIIDPQGVFGTFIGRVALWNEIFVNILDSNEELIFGIGYGSSKEIFSKDLWGVEIKQSHNLIVETIVSIGVVGLVILLFLLFKAYTKYVKHLVYYKEPTKENALLKTGLWMFLFFVIRGLTEGSIAQAGGLDYLFFALSLVVVVIIDQKRKLLISD